MNFTYYGQRPPQPLTLFWKLVITLAAIVGVSTCAVLGLIYVHFFVGTPATVDVLERQLTKQDAIPAIQDEEGDAKIGEARFLASYEDISYYAAPGMISGVACLVGKSPWDDYWSYWEACSEIRDGRDVLVQVQDPDSRGIMFVPDQFDHSPLEREGWVTLHRNLLILPLSDTPQPDGPPQPAGPPQPGERVTSNALELETRVQETLE